MRTHRLALLAVLMAAAAAADDGTDPPAWRLVPLRVQLMRSERLAGADDTDNAGQAQIAASFALRGPDDGSRWLRASVAFDEPLTDHGERLPILQRQPMPDQPLVAASSGQHAGRGFAIRSSGAEVALTIEPPTAGVRTLRIAGTLDLVVGDGAATDGLLRADAKDATLAMTDVADDQTPRIAANDARNVRLAIGDDALARIAAIAFVNGAGHDVQWYPQGRKPGELAFFVLNWPADGAVRISWYAHTRVVKTPFSVEVVVPGPGIGAVDETVRAEPVP